MVPPIHAAGEPSAALVKRIAPTSGVLHRLQSARGPRPHHGANAVLLRRETIMRCWKFLLPSLLGLACVQAVAGCYTVYDQSNRIMFQSSKPPVDMSLPLHETVPARFPGGAMVFDIDGGCPVVSSVAMGNGGMVTTTSSPLLTDTATARRLNLPHQQVGNNIALVPAATVRMEPGVTVVPATAVASKSTRDTIITEFRNPAITITRRGDEMVLSENR
jgi:hypothetical protein